MKKILILFALVLCAFAQGSNDWSEWGYVIADSSGFSNKADSLYNKGAYTYGQWFLRDDVPDTVSKWYVFKDSTWYQNKSMWNVGRGVDTVIIFPATNKALYIKAGGGLDTALVIHSIGALAALVGGDIRVKDSTFTDFIAGDESTSVKIGGTVIKSNGSIVMAAGDTLFPHNILLATGNDSVYVDSTQLYQTLAGERKLTISGGNVLFGNGDTVNFRNPSLDDTFRINVRDDTTVLFSDNPIRISGAIRTTSTLSTGNNIASGGKITSGSLVELSGGNSILGYNYFLSGISTNFTFYYGDGSKGDWIVRDGTNATLTANLNCFQIQDSTATAQLNIPSRGIRGHAHFSGGTCQVDTIVCSGVTDASFVFLTQKGTAAGDALSAGLCWKYLNTDSFVVYCAVGDTTAMRVSGYTWFRVE